MKAPDVQTRAGGPASADKSPNADILPDPIAHDKPRQHLAAELALIGGGLHHLASGAYLVTRFGMGREFPDLRAVAAFVQQMTGRRA